MLLTDAPPRKAGRAGFLESDRIKRLDLPHDGRLPSITGFIELAMKAGHSAAVWRATTDFLKVASDFYNVPDCGIRVLSARPLRVREHTATELFGDYAPETMLIRLWMRTAVHDEANAHSPWFRRWQRYGVCCRPESPVLRLGRSRVRRRRIEYLHCNSRLRLRRVGTRHPNPVFLRGDRNGKHNHY